MVTISGSASDYSLTDAGTRRQADTQDTLVLALCVIPAMTLESWPWVGTGMMLGGFMAWRLAWVCLASTPGAAHRSRGLLLVPTEAPASIGPGAGLLRTLVELVVPFALLAPLIHFLIAGTALDALLGRPLLLVAAALGLVWTYVDRRHARTNVAGQRLHDKVADVVMVRPNA